MNPLLAVAGGLYRLINRARRALYRAGVLRSGRLPRPVISVGNIAAGGAGKTPAVIALARHLQSCGLKVAILTRGYGRSGAEEGQLADGRDAARFGDEPTLIKNSLPNVDVIVGSKRYENASQYLRRNHCDVFVLDDGFQHLQLHRDVDIVIDAPSSFYREGRAALRHADFVIPRRLRLKVPPSIEGRGVVAFSGLADNEQFFDALRSAGVPLLATFPFPDHHRYTPADLDGIERRARDLNAGAIVTTEKDAVKIDRRDMIPVRAEFVIEPNVLDQIMARLGR